MTFKVRASGAGLILTEPRTKSETLSETCKKYIREQWIYDTFKREKSEYATPAIQKGLLNEEQGISMLARKWSLMLKKNTKYLSDDYMTGTADIVEDEKIADIKCNYNIFTFSEAEITKNYNAQLQVYMHLWGKPNASLVYVLTDTPDEVLRSEARSAIWKLNDDSLFDDVYNEMKRQGTYSDIPQHMRIKEFTIDYDPAFIERLIERVKLCQDFYKSLSL